MKWFSWFSRTREIDPPMASFLGSLRSRGMAVDSRLRTAATVLTAADAEFIATVGEAEIAKALRQARQTDAPFAPLTEKQYREVGFFKTELGTWCHPDGDEMGDAILRGEISFEEAALTASERERRRTREHYAITGEKPWKLPPLEEPVIEEVRPGLVRWVEKKGQRVRDVFRHITN